MRSNSPEMDTAISELRQHYETHLKLSKAVIQAYGGSIYVFDLLVIASLNRSISLLDAFCKLIEVRNFIAAAALVRLQIDTALRMHASHISPDPHDFSFQVLSGVRVNKLKDKHGNRMTDRHLVDTLAIKHPWIIDVYKNTSGYVHLSEKHIFNAISAKDDKSYKLDMKVSPVDEFVPEQTYLEAIGAFKAATEIFFEFVHGWAFTKDNPEVVEQILRGEDE